MGMIRQFRRLVFAQVLLGIVAFCIAVQNPVMLLVAGALGALAWYVTEGPSARPLPAWLTNVALPLLAVAWLGYEVLVRGGDLIRAMGYFTMWLQIILLYGRKQNREYAELLVFSVLLMIAASLISVSIFYGVLLLAYCVVTLITVLLFQFKTTSDRVQRENQQAAPDPSHVGRPKPVVGRGHRWHFRVMTVCVGLLCGAIGAAAFVLTPRTDAAAMLLNLEETREQVNQEQAPGFSDRVRVGGSQSERFSNDSVLTMKVWRDGEAIGEGETWRLRGAVLDRYNPSTQIWRRSEQVQTQDRKVQMGEQTHARRIADIETQGADLEARITVRQSGRPHLFTVMPTTWVASEHFDRLQVNPVDYQILGSRSVDGRPYRIRWTEHPPIDWSEQYTQSITDRFPEAYSDPSILLSMMRQTPFDEDAYAKDWPADDQRIQQYAQQVLHQHGITRNPEVQHDPHDPQIIQILADHLRNEFEYSLENPPLARYEDPIAEFLYHYRQGHCELYASALAAMARSLGMQSRLVTGYVVSEYNRVAGYYVVRRRHAHAWTEVNLGPGAGWHEFDPTPVLEEGAIREDRSWWTTAREFYEHGQFLWLSTVVTFDQGQQERLVASMQTSIRDTFSDESTWGGRLAAWLQRLPEIWQLDRINYTFAGLIIILIGLGLAYLAWLLWHRRQRLAALQLTALSRNQRRGLTRRLGFYLTMLDMLERHGYVRPHWQSPFSFAQELAEANPLRFDPVVALTEIFYEIRFGHREVDEDRRRRIQSHLKQLEHALAHPEA